MSLSDSIVPKVFHREPTAKKTAAAAPPAGPSPP